MLILKLDSFAIKISREEAEKLLDRQLGLLGRLIIGRKPPNEIRVIFIENKLITYEITTISWPIIAWFGKNATPRKSKIRVIANGSTSGVAYYDGTGLKISEMEVDDKQVQWSSYSESALVTRGNVLARRILRRRVGGNMILEPLEVKTVFRPYYVAFYGDLKEGNKVRYVPIPADDCVVKRTF
ncbi:MAG: hypothetical protein LBJ36_07185 [Synergistaceae bacterium]|nr:hypothetical protein [Synergistaceae bacterium]